MGGRAHITSCVAREIVPTSTTMMTLADRVQKTVGGLQTVVEGRVLVKVRLRSIAGYVIILAVSKSCVVRVCAEMYISTIYGAEAVLLSVSPMKHAVREFA